MKTLIPLLLLSLAACGSADSTDEAATSGGVLGNCNDTSSKICSEYSYTGDLSDSIKAGYAYSKSTCVGSTKKVTEGSGCPRTGARGTCEIANGGYVATIVYPTTFTAEVAKSLCTVSTGTFKAL